MRMMCAAYPVDDLDDGWCAQDSLLDSGWWSWMAVAVHGHARSGPAQRCVVMKACQLAVEMNVTDEILDL